MGSVWIGIGRCRFRPGRRPGPTWDLPGRRETVRWFGRDASTAWELRCDPTALSMTTALGTTAFHILLAHLAGSCDRVPAQPRLLLWSCKPGRLNARPRRAGRWASHCWLLSG